MSLLKSFWIQLRGSVDACDVDYEKAPLERGFCHLMERVTRIELAWRAWKARVLPLNYTRSG